MSKYYVTLEMDHKGCKKVSSLGEHICPLAQFLPMGVVYCGAQGCAGEQEKIMENCPVEEVVVQHRIKKPVKHIACSCCGTRYHDHLEECPECGFIEE